MVWILIVNIFFQVQFPACSHNLAYFYFSPLILIFWFIKESDMEYEYSHKVYKILFWISYLLEPDLNEQPLNVWWNPTRGPNQESNLGQWRTQILINRIPRFQKFAFVMSITLAGLEPAILWFAVTSLVYFATKASYYISPKNLEHNQGRDELL